MPTSIARCPHCGAAMVLSAEIDGFRYICAECDHETPKRSELDDARHDVTWVDYRPRSRR